MLVYQSMISICISRCVGVRLRVRGLFSCLLLSIDFCPLPFALFFPCLFDFANDKPECLVFCQPTTVTTGAAGYFECSALTAEVSLPFGTCTFVQHARVKRETKSEKRDR
jgi:hypothetical protein